MALKHIMINDIIAEHSTRMSNLKRYYPFFVLNETTFTQYKEGKYGFLDMGYITMATLRFFINENNFHERDITFEEYEVFLSEILKRDFELDVEPEEEKQLITYIFDKIKNDGKAFEFRFYDPENKTSKIARVKLVESRIENGKVLYTITSDGIEFYLDTKEIKDESKISVSQLLLEKMITSNNFKGGMDVVKRINNRVTQLKLEKEQVLKLLAKDVFEGTKAYDRYIETTTKWFKDEQKLFAKNKALIDSAIQRASLEKSDSNEPTLRSKALEEISNLETELKMTIYNHSELISETMDLQQLADKIISKAKLRKLRPIFDFANTLSTVMKEDKPSKMAHIMFPLFMPQIKKEFSVYSIDNILTLKNDNVFAGEKVDKQSVDFDFRYDDELLDQRIAKNFARLFYELLDQINKRGKINLKELNGIYEIRFDKKIYQNRDYYAFLVHLAGKKEYSMRQILKKPDTLLEEMVVEHLSKDDKDKFADLAFTIEFENEDIEILEGCYVSGMIFERRNG